jgi:ABC-type nitrate/sulfonate/bicarbonate transport system ATPase subunit
VSAPQVLALDEPLGALDDLTPIEMQRLVEQVWLSNGPILVTHDVTEAVALGDRIVLIDHGAIAADTPVDLARPRRRGSPARKRQFLSISLRRQTELGRGRRPSKRRHCADLRLRVF